MIVNYFGDGCFRLQSGERTVLLNPASNRLKGDVVLRTIVPAGLEPPADEIVFPGEYEAGGIDIRGWGVPGESTDKYLKTVFRVTWEEIRFALLGHLSHMPPDAVIEGLADADVLIVPTGKHFLSAVDAVKLVKKIEPSIIVPSFYDSPKEFLKEVGQKAEVQEKLVFKKKELADTKGRVVVLEAKG